MDGETQDFLEIEYKYNADDIWQYQVFYETGNYPKSKDRKKKYKELVNKHRE